MMDFDKSYTDVFNQSVEDRQDKMDYERHTTNTTNTPVHLDSAVDLITRFQDLYKLAKNADDAEDMANLRSSFVDLFLNEVDALPWHETYFAQKLNMQVVDLMMPVITSYIHDFHELAAIEDTFREKEAQIQAQIDFITDFPKDDFTVDASILHEMVEFCHKKADSLTTSANAAKNAHYMKLSPRAH